MQKLMFIILILAAVLLSACGANPDGFIEDSSTDQTTAQETTALTTTTATVAATTAETTVTTKKPIQQQAQVAEIITTTKQPTTEATTKVNEDRTIPLSAETTRGDEKLTFKAVRLYYNDMINKNMAVFSYETESKTAALPIESQTKCIGLSGKSYEAKGMGGTGNKGEIHFYNVPDFSDLSTVTLTYAFVGFDPVTVKIDIAGI